MAQLRLLFAVEAAGSEHQLAYVRYLVRKPFVADTALRLLRYRWEFLGKQPRYGIIDISHIIKPVFMQPHPSRMGDFFYNSFL